MSRETIDASLRSMRWGFQIAGDDERVKQLDDARAVLPSDVSAEWETFLRALFLPLYGKTWRQEDVWKLYFAGHFSEMCKSANGEFGNLPGDVRAKYAEYKRKPHAGKMANWKMLAGAFALARGYRGRDGDPCTLSSAGQWVLDNDVLEAGVRIMGLTYPGLDYAKNSPADSK